MSDIEAQRGQLLTELRERRLWTRERLAKEAGVSPTTVGHAEQGRTHIRLDTIRKLAEALDVDPQGLLHPEREPVAAPKVEPPLPEAGQRRPRSPWVRYVERRIDWHEKLFGRRPGAFNAPLTSLDTAIQFASNVGTELARIKDAVHELAALDPDADEVRELTEVLDRFAGFVDRVDSKVSEMYRAEQGEEAAKVVKLKLVDDARSA